jgi:hypothetical protein
MKTWTQTCHHSRSSSPSTPSNFTNSKHHNLSYKSPNPLLPTPQPSYRDKTHSQVLVQWPIAPTPPKWAASTITTTNKQQQICWLPTRCRLIPTKPNKQPLSKKCHLRTPIRQRMTSLICYLCPRTTETMKLIWARVKLSWLSYQRTKEVRKMMKSENNKITHVLLYLELIF